MPLLRWNSFVQRAPAVTASERSGAPIPVTRRELLLTSALLVLVALLLFGRALFGDGVLYFRDILHQYWPGREAVANALRQGVFPEWDPAQQAGLPLAANPHLGLFYPPNALYFLFDFPTAYALLIAAHHVVGGLGVWRLARLAVSGGAALSGALLFMASGYIVGLHTAAPLFFGVSLVPWVLWALVAQNPARRRLVMVALLLAAQSLCGDPIAVIFSGVAALCLIVGRSDWRPLLLILLGAGALAVLLAAVQLVPAFTLFANSTREGAPTDAGFGSWSMSPVRVFEFAFPFLFGKYLDTPPYWASFLLKGVSSTPFSLSLYLGASSAMLVFLGGDRRALLRFGVLLGGLGVLLALGDLGPAAGFLRAVPPFSFFRYSEKYAFLVVLSSGLLLAHAAEALFVAQLRPPLWRWGVAFAFCMTVLSGAALLTVDSRWAEDALRPWLETRRAGGLAPGAVESIRLALLHGGAFAALALALAGLRARLRTAWASVAAAALVATDLLTANAGLIWTGPRELFELRPPLVEELKEAAPKTPFRFWRDNVGFERTAPKASTLESFTARRGYELATLKSSTATVFQLEEISGYSAVNLRRWTDVAVGLYDSPDRMLQVFGGCLALTPPGGGHLAGKAGLHRLPAGSPLYWLFGVDTCLDRLRSVQRTVVADSPRAAVERILSPSFSLADEVTVEGGPTGEYAPVELTHVQSTPDGISAELKTPHQKAFIVFATSFYPGWSAAIDGKAAELRIVNGATMGVEVPEEARRVSFDFKDQQLRWGALWSALGGVLVVLGWCVRRRGAQA